MAKFNESFSKAATKTTRFAGSHWAFTGAFASIVLWAGFGPYTGYSPQWQLVVNTGTTLVTYLMVFLIQNTQNREDKVIQLKLNEILRALPYADKSMISMEDLSEAELEELADHYKKLAEQFRSHK